MLSDFGEAQNLSIRELPSKRGFPSLVQWLDLGKVAPKLTATYSLDRLADAHRASETSRTVGKIAVVIP